MPMMATGTAGSVTVTMDGDKSLTATFDATVTLSISVVGGGSTSPSAGSHTYGLGEVVPVTATGGADGFAGWTGAATGTGNPATITLPLTGLGTHTVTAAYTPPAAIPTHRHSRRASHSPGSRWQRPGHR